MALPATVETIPLETDIDGVVRVGGTRVMLSLVVGAFLDGATAEEIQIRYPVLDLADIYATIAYYLRHRGAVDEYVAAEHAETTRLREQAQAMFDTRALRDRLLARAQRQ